MFAKLFPAMYDGTIVQAGWHTLITFQQLIILADQDGVVDMTIEAIHRRTTIPIDIITEGIENLEKPDEFSRSEAFEGRRIIRINPDRPWGWKLTNYEHYRDLRSSRDRREYMRDYMRERRSKQPLTQLAAVRPSDSDSDSDSTSDSEKTIEPTALTQAGTPEPGGELSLSGGSCASDPCVQVFDHWRTVMNHPQARLDPKRRACITKALKLYAPEALCTAISGYRNSPFHMGTDLVANPSGTVYDALTTLLRDAEHIDRGIAFAKTGPIGAASAPIRSEHNARKSASQTRELVLEMARRRDGNAG